MSKLVKVEISNIVVFDYPDSKTGEPKLRRGTVVAKGTNSKGFDYIKIESPTMQLVKGRPASTFTENKILGEVIIVE